MRRSFFLSATVLLFLFPGMIRAQSSYSLSDCIRIATTENARVKQAQVAVEAADAAREGSIYAYIPSLSLSNQHSLSTGRALDPTTYQFVTSRSVYDMSASIGGSMILFSGLERYHGIQEARLKLRSALLESEKTRNDLTLNVTALFLEILLDKENIALCERKILMLQEQEERIRKRVEHQVATPGDLMNIQADITGARVELVSANNRCALNKVSLCELLGINDWESFDISAADQDLSTTPPRLWSGEDVVFMAERLPQSRQSELAVELARREVNIASSAFYPTLKLNAGYGSTFSNARSTIDGTEYFFRDQLRDNQSSYLTLSLSIPLFSAFSVHNSVKQKRLACTRAEWAYVQTRLAMEREIKQAIIQAYSAYEKYLLLEVDVEKCTEALRQTGEKYTAGAATYYDYQAAVGNLFQASTQQLQAQYEYIFRTKILDFYFGEPLEGPDGH